MQDLARIYVKGGDGGNGKVSFRHEKFAPKGGPDGGDGGRGGDVVVTADENLESLIEFNYQKKYVAKDGEHGLIKKMHGKDRADVVVRVPVGTVVWEIPVRMAESNLRERPNFEQVLAERRQLVDLEEHGKSYTVAYGGKGGRGNTHFKSATNQTPMEAEEGKPGEERWLMLELKVVANIGIIGLPNVGKSSLLKSLTRANPKIAGYPFTTLEPNLGVFKMGEKPLILVDVPGVVEEAYEGKGIGPWFLRHLERSQRLIHVLAPDEHGDLTDSEAISAQLLEDYRTVRSELEKYGNAQLRQGFDGERVPEKKELVVVNKMELIEEKMRGDIGKQLEDKTGKKIVFVSAGMEEVGELAELLH